MRTTHRVPSGAEQRIVDGVQVRLIRAKERARFMRLLDKHHYLGGFGLSASK